MFCHAREAVQKHIAYRKVIGEGTYLLHPRFVSVLTEADSGDRPMKIRVRMLEV